MPRQANGQYLPPANTAAVTATTISSSAYNTLETDIGTEITNSLDRLGRSAMQANLPMGANKITGVAEPTVTTDAATKNYVDSIVATFFSTGDMKPSFKTAADSGWVAMSDGTSVGNGSSGATRANTDCQALFTLLWNNCNDAACPVSSGRGASAAADWAGNKKINLPLTSGRVFAGYLGGSRALGSTYGAETVTLGITNMPSHDHGGFTGSMNQNSIHSHLYNQASLGGGGIVPGGGSFGITQTATATNTANVDHQHLISSQGNNTAFSISPPTTVVTWMIKL